MQHQVLNMKKTARIIKPTIPLCILASALLSQSLMAAPIAKETGFSGFIAGGVMGLEYKSNFIAGNAIDDSISNDTINSLEDEASTESTVLPNFDYNFKYTFAEAETEIFFGTELLDLLTFDGITRLGVRKNFSGVGILGISALASTVPTEVWADPYDTSKPRQSTERNTAGVAIAWEQIAGSKFDLEVRARKLEIDGGDKSGLNAPYIGEVAHGLTDVQLNNQLNREGDLKLLIASYTWNFDKKHFLRPEFRYHDYDLDGQAMKAQESELRLNYLYNGANWKLVGVVVATQLDFDNINPLFGRKADGNAIGAGFTAGYKNPFGWSKKFSLLGTVGVYEFDSDINFYNMAGSVVGLNALYRF